MRELEAALAANPWAIREESLGAFVATIREKEANPEALSAKDGNPLDNTDRVTLRNGVAVIPIRGVINRYDSWYSWLFGGSSLETLSTDFQEALENPQVTAILFDVNSPGGQAAGIDELAQRIRAASATKPVWAYVESEGSSAAYWLAAACERIVMSRAAMVGSIGTVITVLSPDPSSRAVQFVSSQSPGKRPDPTTQSGKDRLQTLVDAVTDVFVAAVAEYRDVSPETVLADFGEGGMLVGQAAVDAGMADACGTFEDTLAELAGKNPSGKSRPTFGGRMPGMNAQSGEETPRMSFWDEMKALFNKAGIKVEGDAAADTTAASGAQDAEKEQLRKQLAEARSQGHKAQAEALYTAELSAGRVFPAEKAEFIAGFVQAAQDDTISPLTSGSRVDQLKARQAKRVPHDLTQEQLAAMDPDAAEKKPASPATALENKAETGKKEQAATIDTQDVYARRAKVTGSR